MMSSSHQKMQAEDQGIAELFSASNTFKVPLYQRHYVWDNINWGHLWEDIEEKSDLRFNNKEAKVHFTGVIVIQEIHSDALLEIIDGQQRLTTFQIIYCAIRDICNDIKVPTEVDTYIRIGELTPVGTSIKYKLLPREGSDQDVFLSLVEKTHEKVEGKNLIWEAYIYFKDKIIKYVTDDRDSSGYNKDKLHHLYDSIVHDFKVVKITANSDYAKIFKSINGTGRHLDQFDLLRNDLFLRAGGKKRDNLYKTYWSHFEENPDWRKPKMVDNFLENFLKVKLRQDFDEQLTLFDLYELYCKKLTKGLKLNETDPKLVEHEFYDLNRYSNVYHDMYISDSGKIRGRIKFYDQFNDKLTVVDDLKLFILFITNEFGLSTQELDRIFSLFEAYFVRGMLHIGSKGNYSRSLRKLNDLFPIELDRQFRSLYREKSFSLISLVYLLSREWITDQDVKVALDRLPPTKAKREKSKSNLMREFGGSFIFDVLGWEIDHETELFDKFREKWPSAEVMLQQELIDELPIVYSRIPISVQTINYLGLDSEDYVSAQAKPRLENYVFVTYQSMKELSEYEIDENSVTGVAVDSEEEEIVTIDLKEILFAFPITAKCSMQRHINRIADEVKDRGLVPESTQEVFDLKNWLFEVFDLKNWLFNKKPEFKMIVENFNSEHWILPNIEATVVTTRAGHELRGTLKSCNDRAIYLEIDEHIITVYVHGIYKIEKVIRTRSRKESLEAVADDPQDGWDVRRRTHIMNSLREAGLLIEL